MNSKEAEKEIRSLREWVAKLERECQTEVGKLQERVDAQERCLETRGNSLDAQMHSIKCLNEYIANSRDRYSGDAQMVGWLNELNDRITQLEKNQAPVEVMKPGGGFVFHPDTYDQIFDKIYQDCTLTISSCMGNRHAIDLALRVLKLLPHPYKRG